MEVYRICSDWEISTILKSKSTSEVGSTFINNTKINTFDYNPTTKYLHFFQKYEDIFYLDCRGCENICTYDIPEEILAQSQGIGFYYDRINFRHIDEAIEFAVDVNLLDFSYLKRVDKITSILLFEDYLEGDIQEYLKNIYDANKFKILRKLKGLG